MICSVGNSDVSSYEISYEFWSPPLNMLKISSWQFSDKGIGIATNSDS